MTHSHVHNRSGVQANITGIERRFVRDIGTDPRVGEQGRFERLRGLVRQTVDYPNDALKLGPEKEGRSTPFSNADEREAFDFPTRAGITRAFIQWLQDAIRDEILEPVGVEEVRSGKHWTAKYIRSAFINGVNQSTGLLLQQGVGIDNIPDEDITSRPIFATTLKDLYQRTYENLESISEDMAPTVRETLTEGYAKGWHPRKMADNLTNELRDMQRNRAETLARSETMNAHSTAMLDNYERAGVTIVAHEWDAANDNRTCPFCERLDGVRLSTDEVRGGSIKWAIESDWKPQLWRLQPPAHPNCRCVLRPIAGADEPDTDLSERVAEEFDRATAQ